jgi:hypothetical protein
MEKEGGDPNPKTGADDWNKANLKKDSAELGRRRRAAGEFDGGGDLCRPFSRPNAQFWAGQEGAPDLGGTTERALGGSKVTDDGKGGGG